MMDAMSEHPAGSDAPCCALYAADPEGARARGHVHITPNPTAARLVSIAASLARGQHDDDPERMATVMRHAAIKIKAEADALRVIAPGTN